jgi:hypothetical protein
VFFDPLFLETAEEGFSYRVIPAIASAAHAGLKMVRFAITPPGIAAVLRALIRMDQRAARSSTTYGHQIGIEHELAMDRCTGRPANDPSRVNIHDDGQIQPTLPGASGQNGRRPRGLARHRPRDDLVNSALRYGASVRVDSDFRDPMLIKSCVERTGKAVRRREMDFVRLTERSCRANAGRLPLEPEIGLLYCRIVEQGSPAAREDYPSRFQYVGRVREAQ